jgi:hypothetical protein
MKKLLLAVLMLGLLAACRVPDPTPASIPAGQSRATPRAPGRPNTKRTTTPCPTCMPCPTCIPCPTLLPSPTPKPTSTIANRAQPVPFGEPFDLIKGGDKVFSLTVTQAYRGEDAWERIFEINQFNDPPLEGMEYVLLYVEVDYQEGPAGESLQLDEWDFRIFSQNHIFKPEAIVGPEPEFGVELFPPAKGGGWMTWAVFVEDENPLLVIGMESDGSGGFFFSATP